MTVRQRMISEVRPSQATQDGAGVAIQRVALMGHPGTDPILLIDELKSPFREDFEAGFPSHPHRGMQTLTYMKRGGLIHEDSLGNRGEIRDGGAQWMSAGCGVIHSEMPTQDTQGLHGFQLWFNLPAAEKMRPPRYRDIPADQLTALRTTAFSATAVAGDWQLNGQPLTGPLVELTPQGTLLDLDISADALVDIAVATDDSLLAYVYDGSVVGTEETIPAGHLLVATDGDCWQLQAGKAGARLLVLSGRPIRETVVGYGPFVMNTRVEIEQALQDYRDGNFAQQ